MKTTVSLFVEVHDYTDEETGKPYLNTYSCEKYYRRMKEQTPLCNSKIYQINFDIDDLRKGIANPEVLGTNKILIREIQK